MPSNLSVFNVSHYFKAFNCDKNQNVILTRWFFVVVCLFLLQSKQRNILSCTRNKISKWYKLKEYKLVSGFD